MHLSRPCIICARGLASATIDAARLRDDDERKSIRETREGGRRPGRRVKLRSLPICRRRRRA